MRVVSSLTNTGSGPGAIASLSGQASTTCGFTLAAGGSCLLRALWSAWSQSPGVFVFVTTTFAVTTVPAVSPTALTLCRAEKAGEGKAATPDLPAAGPPPAPAARIPPS